MFDVGGASGSGVVPTTGGNGGSVADGQGGTANGGTSAQAGSTGHAGNANGGVANGGTSDGGASNAGQAGSVAQSGSGGQSNGGASAGGSSASNVVCAAKFSFPTSSGQSSVEVAGEWNNFDLASATPLVAGGGGALTATVSLAPGLWAYKLIVGGTWELDPGQGRRKYVGGIENSAIQVDDCSQPSFEVTTSQATYAASNAGTYAATLSYVDGVDASGPLTTSFTATLTHDTVVTPITSGFSVDATGGVTLSLSGLAPGKYTALVTPQSNTHPGRPTRLIFWIEETPYEWNDAEIYMVVTDRFRNGDTSNDAAALPSVDPREQFQGGDLQGVKQAIDDGTLDKLGVRAIWLTPFFTNPPDAWIASDNVHETTGYHGYWPIHPREVDPRIGGADALHAMVTSAHAHGIRILQDFMLNDVHQEHDYFAAHPEWFRTGCVCGTDNCDWTTHALDCLFASYLPDVNHTVPAATAQFVSDGVYWLDTFDLDGLRIDAVKHVEQAATRNLAAEVREQFQAAGNHYFLMGETAMGWTNCADPCNDINYDTISQYIGPLGLDGQFDFVLYYAAGTTAFAFGQESFLHVDYWFQHGLSKWPAGSIMTPYLGSHDTARFVSLAQYGASDGTPNNQWDNIASPPPAGSDAYVRSRLGFTWLLSLPGAPLVYYGDEYGQWGGVDPNNRVMMKPEASLTADETETLGSFAKRARLARSWWHFVGAGTCRSPRPPTISSCSAEKPTQAKARWFR